MPHQTIPNEIMLAVLENAAFTKDGERDLDIAEQIASTYYPSMDGLLSTIRGEIRVKKYLKEFNEMVVYLSTNENYAQYFTNCKNIKS